MISGADGVVLLEGRAAAAPGGGASRGGAAGCAERMATELTARWDTRILALIWHPHVPKADKRQQGDIQEARHGGAKSLLTVYYSRMCCSTQ